MMGAMVSVGSVRPVAPLVGDNTVETSDEALMKAYVAGDQAAYRALFERHAPILYRFARRRLSTDDEARDVLQQTMLHVHRARRDFREGSRLRPWLFTIALNLVREHYRRKGRRKEQPLSALPREPQAQPVTPLEDAQRAQRVRAALARIPLNQREVIELHWFEELPYEEIAPIVGASVSAVRVRAHRGYERLRVLLADKE
jgi:RNA polymerase sigma-70 factor (ECF subfamily)